MKLTLSSLRFYFLQGFILPIIILSSAVLCANPGKDFPSVKSYRLENDHVTAQFNGSGLINIYRRGINKDFRFDNDGFSVMIDSQLIAQKDLSLVSVKKENDRIVYSFSNKDVEIRLIYELKPTWNFISKQIEINSKTRKTFKVNQVHLLVEKLGKQITGEYVPHGWWPGYSTKNFGAFLRFGDGTGLLALIQNPFQDYNRTGQVFSLSYSADMDWDKDWGNFISDRACLVAYRTIGRKIPVNMIPEWKWTKGIIPEVGVSQDEAEVNAFINCVEQFILDRTPRPINVHVAWCENDFQEDVSMASGREVYKRIIDQAAAVGSKYMVDTPTTSDLGTFADAVDGWRGEGFLWLGLGIKFRKNEWNPEKDTLPASIREMLDHAKKRDVKLLAYVYPGMPFQQDQSWLVPFEEGGVKKQYANLGFRHFQDWLINSLTVFMKKTGIGGYSFDYTFLNYPGKSVYAQWKGWCRVMETLRDRFPDIIIDGRQTYQYYGPWSWLAGSYPHPTSTDEQPQSFVPFPDLHFDRASANRTRYANYRFRIRDYCPPFLMPGYMTHQTPRFNLNQQVPFDPFRIRDWDYLGWKYSIISSIAVGGLNNVINMIPARDPMEFRHFSNEDKTFFRKWLDWTRDNRSYLEQTRPIMGQPAIGKTDGTTAIIGNKGYIFLFNPNGRSLPAKFNLDESIGLGKSQGFLLKEMYPVNGRLIGKPGAGKWSYGDQVTIQMDGASALMLYIEPDNATAKENKLPILFNVQGKAELNNNILTLDSVAGEKGTIKEVMIQLPNENKIETVTVNQGSVAFQQQGNKIQLRLHFDGEPFPQMKQIGSYDSLLTEGYYRASFRIPQRIIDQLIERSRKWPIAWSGPDFDTPWLVPHRLLLFIQLAEPSDNMELRMKINGETVELKKAYSEIRKVTHTFLGFYADISTYVAGKDYNVELLLPPLAPGQFQGLFLENIETEYTNKLVVQ